MRTQLIKTVESSVHCKPCQPVATNSAFAATTISQHVCNFNSMVGPIPWGHSGPLCHALSLSSLSWTSMCRRRTTVPLATSGELAWGGSLWRMGPTFFKCFFVIFICWPRPKFLIPTDLEFRSTKEEEERGKCSYIDDTYTHAISTCDECTTLIFDLLIGINACWSTACIVFLSSLVLIAQVVFIL